MTSIFISTPFSLRCLRAVTYDKHWRFQKFICSGKLSLLRHCFTDLTVDSTEDDNAVVAVESSAAKTGARSSAALEQSGDTLLFVKAICAWILHMTPAMALEPGIISKLFYYYDDYDARRPAHTTVKANSAPLRSGLLHSITTVWAYESSVYCNQSVGLSSVP